MKLAFVTHQYFPQHIGGTEMFVHSLAKRAIRRGHSVTVLTCVESGVSQPELLQIRQSRFEGEDLIEFDFNLSLMPNRAQSEYRNEFMAKRVRQVLSELQPDVVHVAHAMKFSAAIFDVLQQFGIPTVLTLSDFWFICPQATLMTWKHQLCSGPAPAKCMSCLKDMHRVPFTLKSLLAVNGRKSYMRKQLLKPDRVIALSQFQKNLFTQHGMPGDRIEVIRHGLEIDGLQSASDGRRSAGPHVGFIGSLVPHKGAHILVAALSKLERPDLRCTIYGAQHESRYLADLTALADRDGRIELPGTVAPEDLGSALQDFDVLVVPALWYENEPLVVKAAQHLGVPIIASDIGSLSEMLKPGQGQVVPPGCADSLAQAISSALATGSRRHNVRDVKTMDETWSEFENIYESIRKSNESPILSH